MDQSRSKLTEMEKMAITSVSEYLESELQIDGLYASEMAEGIVRSVRNDGVMFIAKETLENLRTGAIMGMRINSRWTEQTMSSIAETDNILRAEKCK